MFWPGRSASLTSLSHALTSPCQPQDACSSLISTNADGVFWKYKKKLSKVAPGDPDIKGNKCIRKQKKRVQNLLRNLYLQGPSSGWLSPDSHASGRV